MNTKYLYTLEYDKIIEILKSYCKTYIGKENILNLKPCFHTEKVSHLLNETNEAVNLIIRKSNIPLSEISDISLWIKQLESSSILSAKALLEVATILKISRELKEYFYSDDSFDTCSFPILSDLFSNLYTNKGIEEKIFTIILDENIIADNASSKLFSIRKQVKKLEQDIRDKLNSFIHSNTYSKYMMEQVITIRNDRFVIPVKEEYKSFVKGFIHDVSSSGSTVFIEPISIFEMNNQIASLKVEENIEIEKILQNLSSMLYEYTDYLNINIQIIGNLDLIFAKANYSLAIDGNMPMINSDKHIHLLKARHPLISKDTVVPIDLSIGETYSSLVITGPNTGGKTVTLKTVGLILLMAYSGIFVPCFENSSIYVFDHIFADIGDEQSIQESLSTFSSHMSTIIEITHTASTDSLILLDELGSGTDPIEGANLAISILQYFYHLGALVISTTHYPELKNYCLITSGFENASSEFDIERLQPTYKLLIGIPGKSNAFAISKKLGLKQEILDTAISFMKHEDISIEELMKNIYDDKVAIEKEKIEIEKNSAQIELLRRSLEKENTDVQKHEQEIIEKAKVEARNIVLSAKDDVNNIIRELNQIEKDYQDATNHLEGNGLKRANQLRNQLNNKLQNIDSTGNNENKLNLEVLKTLNSKQQMKNNKILKDNSSKNNDKNKQFSSVSFSKTGGYKSKNVSSEINVIGLNVDEATFVIDKYLDDCVISKLSPVRIVHGKGTGKLRQGIHTYLKTNPHVKSFRLGTFGEGEMGVTVVELN